MNFYGDIQQNDDAGVNQAELSITPNLLLPHVKEPPMRTRFRASVHPLVLKKLLGVCIINTTCSYAAILFLPKKERGRLPKGYIMSSHKKYRLYMHLPPRVYHLMVSLVLDGVRARSPNSFLHPGRER